LSAHRTGLGGVEILKDIDGLALWTTAAPDEAQRLLDRTGVTLAQVEGVVRSVTFRARKPA